MTKRQAKKIESRVSRGMTLYRRHTLLRAQLISSRVAFRFVRDHDRRPKTPMFSETYELFKRSRERVAAVTEKYLGRGFHFDDGTLFVSDRITKLLPITMTLVGPTKGMVMNLTLSGQDELPGWIAIVKSRHARRVIRAARRHP